jgi:hypothetical protein
MTPRGRRARRALASGRVRAPPADPRRDSSHRGQRQLLDARRPADLLDAVGRLTFLQLDPTAVIAPAADLVAWSRLGTAYRTDQLRQALDQERTLFEHNRTRPADRGRRPRPRRDGGLADLRALADLVPGKRRVQARHRRPALGLGAADVARHPGHGSGAVEVDRLDEQPQRHSHAGAPDDARRGRDRRSGRPGAPVGPRRARVSVGRPGSECRGGAPDQERAAPAVARDCARQEHADADRACRRGGRRRAGDGGGRCR